MRWSDWFQRETRAQLLRFLCLMNENLNHQYYDTKTAFKPVLRGKRCRVWKCFVCAVSVYKGMVYSLRFQDVLLYWRMWLRNLVQIHFYSHLGFLPFIVKEWQSSVMCMIQYTSAFRRSVLRDVKTQLPHIHTVCVWSRWFLSAWNGCNSRLGGFRWVEECGVCVFMQLLRCRWRLVECPSAGLQLTFYTFFMYALWTTPVFFKQVGRFSLRLP